MGILFVFNSILLGIGLAADAFSVSVADAIGDPKMRRSRRLLIAGTFAAFQFLMPMIGWACVRWIAGVFSRIQPSFPWIALILLCLIGGKMLIEAIHGDGKNETAENACNEASSEETADSAALSFGGLMLQGIATSIDALSVGFTIEEYGVKQASLSALIIGAVTFLICMLGLLLGRKIGRRLAGRAGIIGGLILIGIGIEIFVRGVFF